MNTQHGKGNDKRCRHCERRPPVTDLGLCARCDRERGVRELYLPQPGRTAADEARLDELRRRANARLPLFPRRCDRAH
jgi:hypothetical protein